MSPIPPELPETPHHMPHLCHISQCLSLIRFFVLGFRMICTEWLTSSWWTSTRTSGARPLLPCRGRRGPTAVSPPGELTASLTGTRDFSLFSKRAELHWTGPEHSRQTETDEAREKEGWHHSTGVTTQPKTGSRTHWGLGGGGSFCTLSVPLLFSSLTNWWHWAIEM